MKKTQPKSKSTTMTIAQLNKDFEIDKSEAAKSLIKAMRATHESRWGKKAMAKKKRENIAYLKQQIVKAKQSRDFLQKSVDEAEEKIERLESILDMLIEPPKE
jgi:hypothetical protein